MNQEPDIFDLLASQSTVQQQESPQKEELSALESIESISDIS